MVRRDIPGVLPSSSTTVCFQHCPDLIGNTLPSNRKSNDCWRRCPPLFRGLAAKSLKPGYAFPRRSTTLAVASSAMPLINSLTLFRSPFGRSAKGKSLTTSASLRISNTGRILTWPDNFALFPYQRMKSFTGSSVPPFWLPFFLTRISVMQLSSPNTSSITTRMRWTFSLPICTKIEPESARRSRATVSRSRR